MWMEKVHESGKVQDSELVQGWEGAGFRFRVKYPDRSWLRTLAKNLKVFDSVPDS